MREKISQEYLSVNEEAPNNSLSLVDILFHPKAIFLTAAFASLLLSVYLWFILEDQLMGIFVGIWVPSILSAGNLILTPTPKTKKDTQHD